MSVLFKRIFHIAAITTAAIVMTILFQNCGVSQPNVELSSYKLTGYTHTGDETACSTCHETARPVTTTGFLALNANVPFDYATHGSGFDCISCHSMTQVSRTQADWANGNFVHTAMTSSCISCHSTQRPTAAVNGFNHATSGTGDCVACHQKSLSSSFSSISDWNGGVGTPAANVYDSGQDINLTSSIPTYSSTSISLLTSQSVTLHMNMNHTTTQITTANLQNCSLCHTGATQGAYFPGALHSSLDAAGISQPTTCVDCHNGASPAGFVGPVDTTRSPQSPAMKHNAVAWTASGSSAVPSTSSLITSDCAVCHQSPPTATSWGSANYHSSLTSHSISQPSSCLDCHANSRPTGITPAVAVASTTSFNHANGGMNDCVSCHTSTSTWTHTGKFHTTVTGTQTSCLSCHSSERPTSTNLTIGGTTTAFGAYDSTNKPFDVATHGGSLDCVSCHASPATNPTITNWRGGNYVHSVTTTTSCVGCHSSQRPTNSAPDLVRTGGFDHTINGQGECIGCHRTSLTNNVFTSLSNWSGGQSQPTGLVGSKTLSLTAIHLNYTNSKITSTNLSAQTPPLQMLHSSAQVPAALSGGTHCVDCHASAGSGNYSGGVFHATLTSHSLAQPTSCNDCHSGSVPTDIIGAGTVLGNSALKPMDHAAAISGGSVTAVFDCYTCHTSTTSFASATFHNKLGTHTISNCTTCHYVVMPSSTTPVNKMVHVSNFNTQDCTSCHTTPTAGQIASPASTNWSGSAFHNNVVTQPTSCTECHSSQKPATTTLSLNNSQYMNHSSTQATGADCAVCHTADLALVTRAWSRSDKIHSFVATTACKDCHGLTNSNGAVAGTGNNLPAGLTNSHHLSTSSVASSTYDQVTHTATDVAGKECNVCHTQVGSTIGSGKISPAWNNASFHINVANVTGQCATCHTNLKPAVVVGGMDHSTITSDCSGCHTYPGTGTTSAGNWLGASDGGPHTYSFMTANAFTAKTATAPEKGCVSCHTLSGSTTAPKGAPLTISIARSTTTAIPATASSTTITFTHSFQATTGGTSANNFTVCLGCHQTAATNALGPSLDGMGIYASTSGAKGLDGWGTLTATGPTGTFNHLIPSAITYSQATGVTVTASAAVNSCLPCHLNRGFAHGGDGHTIFKAGGCVTGKAPQDCIQCHKINYTSWTNPKSGIATCK